MNCPVCKDAELKMSERQGIEIDYCPRCRGVWLDRGELDKIIERSSAEDAPPAPRQQARPPQHDPRYDPNDESKYGYQYKKRKSVWRELFDF